MKLFEVNGVVFMDKNELDNRCVEIGRTGSRVVITPNGLEVQTYDREENDAIIKKILLKHAKTMQKLSDS